MEIKSLGKHAPSSASWTSADKALRAIAESDAVFHVVTDHGGRITGIISLEDLKPFWNNKGLADWLVVFDVMNRAPEPVAGDTPLSDALKLMNQQALDCLPVAGANARYLGILERRSINRAIKQEVLRRRQPAKL